jgi:hypothetical protein
MFAPMFVQMRTATWLGIMLALGMMLNHCDEKLRDGKISSSNPDNDNRA